MNKEIYVFDFDGVICDSTNECMVTSWNAWELWNNRNNFRISLEEFSDKETQSFKELRYYVKGAGDYFALRKLISENKSKKILNYKDFKIFKEPYLNESKKFEEFFFISRKKLKDISIKKWINLHKVFDEVIFIIKKLNYLKKIYIATLKDIDSVKIILKNHGIQISEKNLFHQKIINSKIEALIKIEKIEKINKNKIYLFDDNVDHLIEPYQKGFKTFQTTWGNVPTDYIIESEKLGIPLIKLENMKNIIF